MKDFLRIAELTPDDLRGLVELSWYCQQFPHDHADLLRNETVVCYFAKPSTRTRLSFGSAIAHLGGAAQVVGPTELQLGRGETIGDTAEVISRYARAFVIRTFEHSDVEACAAAASVPVINALTDLHHPCQALADLLTLRQRFHRLEGLKLAYLGDGNNVAHSLLEACALAGVNIAVACPPGYEPDAGIVEWAAATARQTGSTVDVVADPLEAIRDANAVYTDVWVSMGNAEAERAARTEALQPYQVTPATMAAAGPDALFMHCLPAHRGDEVTADVIDGPQSVVFEQAGHRMHTAQALLISLLTGRIAGARHDLVRSASC